MSSLVARVDLGDPIPAGWQILDYKDVGKYSSEVAKLMTDDMIVRLDSKQGGCDDGWKLRGFALQVQKDECATGRLLVNKYGKIDRNLSG